LLDVLDIVASTTNNLSPQVEASNWLEINRNFLLGPFALQQSVAVQRTEETIKTYTTEFVPFDLGLAATKPALVNEVRQILLHHLVDHSDCGTETLL
jgi:hypothetical protein